MCTAPPRPTRLARPIRAPLKIMAPVAMNTFVGDIASGQVRVRPDEDVVTDHHGVGRRPAQHGLLHDHAVRADGDRAAVADSTAPCSTRLSGPIRTFAAEHSGRRDVRARVDRRFRITMSQPHGTDSVLTVSASEPPWRPARRIRASRRPDRLQSSRRLGRHLRAAASMPETRRNGTSFRNKARTRAISKHEPAGDEHQVHGLREADLERVGPARD